MPSIEVEAKYPLSESLDAWRERLLALGAVAGETIEQCDEYFAHPCRNFAATGEAFRMRTVGDENALTYKGPLLDKQTKSRSESEISFASGADSAAQMRDMLLALGFSPAGRVSKRRTLLTLGRAGRTFTLSLDEVAGLGVFLEIEIVTEQADWTAARDALLAVAADLGLGSSERRSYLELLLARGP
ncbi:MAG: class IV adenylate cyclase [Planctomycetaceae bacterium]|nr:class IV adenylate cyclase [Planctomycetaceae bacterium]